MFVLWRCVLRQVRGNNKIFVRSQGSPGFAAGRLFLAVCFVGLFRQTANAPALLLCVINITVLANLLSVIAGGAISNDPVPGLTLTPIW